LINGEGPEINQPLKGCHVVLIPRASFNEHVPSRHVLDEVPLCVPWIEGVSSAAAVVGGMQPAVVTEWVAYCPAQVPEVLFCIYERQTSLLRSPILPELLARNQVFEVDWQVLIMYSGELFRGGIRGMKCGATG